MTLAVALSNTQIYVALVIALIPAILAFRLSTELYK
jgi:photosystem I subunit 12